MTKTLGYLIQWQEWHDGAYHRCYMKESTLRKATKEFNIVKKQSDTVDLELVKLVRILKG